MDPDVIHKDPWRLLQPSAALAALFGSCRPCGNPRYCNLAAAGFLPRSSPRRRVHQAARRTVHPGRESQRWNPSDDGPAPFRRAWRRAQHPVDAEGASHPIHVAYFPVQGIAARAVPGADVLHHHEAVGAAHDCAHRAVAQQMREPNGYVLFSHEACCRRLHALGVTPSAAGDPDGAAIRHVRGDRPISRRPGSLLSAHPPALTSRTGREPPLAPSRSSRRSAPHPASPDCRMQADP